MSKRTITLSALAATVLAAVGILSGNGNGRGAETKAEPTTTAASVASLVPEGDAREKDDGPIATPEAGQRAGAPVATARAFVAEWVNRTASAAELRRQRPILVGLTTGDFATLVQVTIDDALATGDFGPENQGRVVVARRVGGGSRPAVLVVTRERQVENDRGLEPYRFVTYIVRLSAVAGGCAVSTLEPQG